MQKTAYSTEKTSPELPASVRTSCKNSSAWRLSDLPSTTIYKQLPKINLRLNCEMSKSMENRKARAIEENSAGETRILKKALCKSNFLSRGLKAAREGNQQGRVAQ